VHVTSAGNIAVDATISTASIRVEGFVHRDGKPAAGSFPVLVPAGANTNEELFRRDQSDLDGSFTFSNVVPGNYIVVAVDDSAALRWTDLPTLTRYLLHGLPLSVPTTGSSAIHLTEPVTAQPR